MNYESEFQRLQKEIDKELRYAAIFNIVAAVGGLAMLGAPVVLWLLGYPI